MKIWIKIYKLSSKILFKWKKWNTINPYIKANSKIIKFDNTKIEEYDIYQNESPTSINEIVLSNKLPFGKKM